MSHEFDSYEDADALVAQSIRETVRKEQEQYGVCPLMRTACVGPQNCAPARFEANIAQGQAIDELGGLDVVAPTPVCPLTRITMGLVTTASALIPLLLGGAIDAEEENDGEENAQADTRRPEEVIRSAVISKLNIDQTRGSNG